jgi:hypothetical protein
MTDKNKIYYCKPVEESTEEEGFYKFNQEVQDFVLLKETNFVYIKATDWRTVLYFEGLLNKDTSYYANRYSKELAAEWPKVYNIKKTEITVDESRKTYPLPVFEGGYLDEINKNDYQYFLDFIEGNVEDSTIQDLSVLNIGVRTLAENKNGVNCIFPPEIPNLMVIQSGTSETSSQVDEATKQGYQYTLAEEDIYSNITLSKGYNSAYDAVRQMLYTSTGYSESISISAIPVFYLEPNTLIEVFDEESSIQGNYTIKTIALPLDSNGTMTISCKKPIEKM